MRRVSARSILSACRLINRPITAWTAPANLPRSSRKSCAGESSQRVAARPTWWSKTRSREERHSETTRPDVFLSISARGHAKTAISTVANLSVDIALPQGRALVTLREQPEILQEVQREG